MLDALKDPERGYFDPDDAFTALPKALISAKPYASYVVTGDELAEEARLSGGHRIGVVREFMIKPIPNNVAISDQIDGEIKSVPRDQLKATWSNRSTRSIPTIPRSLTWSTRSPMPCPRSWASMRQSTFLRTLAAVRSSLRSLDTTSRPRTTWSSCRSSRRPFGQSESSPAHERYRQYSSNSVHHGPVSGAKG